MEEKTKEVPAVETETNEVAQESVEEVSSVQEEGAVEEQADAVTKEATAEESTTTEEVTEDTHDLSEIEKLKKHDAAVLLVTKTKQIVESTEKQLDECKLLLEDDLNHYKEAKASLKEHALDEAQQLLKELDYALDEDEIEENDVIFETEDDLPPFQLQEVKSGKFSASFLSLITGGVTLAGLLFFAKQKSGVTVSLNDLPSPEKLQEVAGWYGTLFGGTPDPMTGSAFVVGVTALVMGITYAIKVSTRAKKNLHFAKKQLEEAESYAQHKGNCKTEMEKVDAHITDAIGTLKEFEVILAEQNGKLKRIKFIEGIQEDEKYHENSLQEMHDTATLIRAINQFMAVPMSEAGKLSGKSTLFLHSAKSKLQKVLDRFYGA